MKPIARIVGAAVVVLGLAGWYFHPWKKSEDNQYANLPRAKVQRGEFRITIEEQGLFETRKNDTIVTPFSGKIVRLAEDGAHVKKGETVVWMDTEKVTQDLRDQITQLKSVKAELEQRIVDLSKNQRNNSLDLASAGAELDFNRLQLLDVNKKLETMELLAELSLVPQRDLENSELNVESQKLDTLQKDLSYQGKTEDRDTKAKTQELAILQVSIRKDKAMADIDEAKKHLLSAELKAPADGLFLRISYWDWRQGKKTTAKEGTEVWGRSDHRPNPASRHDDRALPSRRVRTVSRRHLDDRSDQIRGVSRVESDRNSVASGVGGHGTREIGRRARARLRRDLHGSESFRDRHRSRHN